MSEPTPGDRETARKWGQQKKPGSASTAVEWAHEQLDGRLQPEIQDVTRNYAAAFAGEVRADGYAHGLAQGRADEIAAGAKCWTCGGDPHSHPSGALCICEDGTHSSEVVNLRMLAQRDTGDADDGPGDMVCKAHDVPGCAECWEAELSDTGDTEDD